MHARTVHIQNCFYLPSDYRTIATLGLLGLMGLSSMPCVTLGQLRNHSQMFQREFRCQTPGDGSKIALGGQRDVTCFKPLFK